MGRTVLKTYALYIFLVFWLMYFPPLYGKDSLKGYTLYIFLVFWFMYFPPLYRKTSFKKIYSFYFSCVLVYVFSSFIYEQQSF